jgi:hypothetical protein
MVRRIQAGSTTPLSESQGPAPLTRKKRRAEVTSGGEGRLLEPAPTTVDPQLYKSADFSRLGKQVQGILRGVLAQAPDRQGSVARLVELEAFKALSAAEQKALLSPPLPERLDQALLILESPVWSLLAGDKAPLFKLPMPTQRAILAQQTRYLVKPVATSLMAVASGDWLKRLSEDDQLRAVKVVAYAASQLVGASEDGGELSQKAIIRRTLDGLTTPGRFRITFEDLPAGDEGAVAGLRRLPGTVVLNRNLVAADVKSIGEGSLGHKEQHVGLITVVHEVDHLIRAVPVGETYAAFQDEYRAWYVGMVAFRGTPPTMIEGLTRCRELITSDEYSDIAAALDNGGPEAAKVVAFLRKFGPVTDRASIMRLEIDNYVALAPPPDAWP